MTLCFLQKHSRGDVLLDEVFKHLDILERDYFGVGYVDSDVMVCVCVCVCVCVSVCVCVCVCVCASHRKRKWDFVVFSQDVENKQILNFNIEGIHVNKLLFKTVHVFSLFASTCCFSLKIWKTLLLGFMW